MTAAEPASKGARTRDTILRAAVRRFAADGFRATSVADIARDVGVTPGAVYAYFPSKDALFRDAVDADSAAYIEGSLGRVFAGEWDGDWRRLFVVLVQQLDQHPLARRLLAGLEPEHTQRMLDLPALQTLRDNIEALLNTRKREGVLPRTLDARLIALGIETIFLAQLIALLQTGVSVDDERTAGIAALFEAALPRPPGEEPRRGAKKRTKRTRAAAGS